MKVILYDFPFMKGQKQPSISAFSMKLATVMRMLGVEYHTKGSMKKGPKGKIPFIDCDGVVVADSTFCTEYLQEKTGKDLNEKLDEKQKSIATLLQRMLEENFYWATCYMQVIDDPTDVKEQFFSTLPYGFQNLFYSMGASSMKKKLDVHGIGRHSREEIMSIAMKDLRAVSGILGTNKFMLSDEPSLADAVVFGMLAAVPDYVAKDNPVVAGLQSGDEFANLRAYLGRMKEKYWPDWDDIVASGKGHNPID